MSVTTLPFRRCSVWLLLAFAFSIRAGAAEPDPILLWPNGAPGSEGKNAQESVRISPQGDHVVSSVHRPSITPYLPSKDKATGAAVIVIPGGGHRELWMDHEGYRVGRWLSDHGVAAFVLKYRLAAEPGSSYTIEGHSLPDVLRAIRLVRNRAGEWGIAPERIGIIGFSAGGELAARAGTHYDSGNAGASDAIDRESSRPAFQALIYPAIPRDMKLSEETPAAFLLCGENNRPDISRGLAQLYLAFKQAGVPVELHILTGIGHGFGIRDDNPRAVSNWISLFCDWLEARAMLKHN
jgi:acetyl esterase/lipase